MNIAKFIYRWRHGNAFWFLGFYHSPRMVARTERFMRRLEQSHAELEKIFADHFAEMAGK